MEHTALLAEALQLAGDHDLVRPRVLAAQSVPRVKFLSRQHEREASLNVLQLLQGTPTGRRLSETATNLKYWRPHLVPAGSLVASFNLRQLRRGDLSNAVPRSRLLVSSVIMRTAAATAVAFAASAEGRRT